ncbi:MAG: hypothetical protein Q9201_005497 [Fulgogasparrea decipioides]
MKKPLNETLYRTSGAKPNGVPEVATAPVADAISNVMIFFAELLDLSSGESSFSQWWRGKQQVQEANRIICALLIILLVQTKLWLITRFFSFVLKALLSVGTIMFHPSGLILKALGVLWANLPELRQYIHDLHMLVFWPESEYDRRQEAIRSEGNKFNHT